MNKARKVVSLAHFTCVTLLAVASSLLVDARCSAQGYSVTVASHGATINSPVSGKDDDAVAIRAALADAMSWMVAHPGEEATLIFETGRYDLRSVHSITPNKPFAILIQDLDTGGQLTLQGNGATLMNDLVNKETIGVNRSSRVTIQDFVFDMDPLPFVQGRVETVNGNVVTVRRLLGPPLADFPAASAASDDFHWGYLLDPVVPGRTKLGTAGLYMMNSATEVGDLMTFDVQIAQGVPIAVDFKPGDRFTYHYRVAGGSSIWIRGDESGSTVEPAQSIAVQSCTCLAAAAMFVNAAAFDTLTVTDCRVEILPGRWRATNAAAVSAQRGAGLRIEDGYFEGVSDDAFNISQINAFAVIGNVITNKHRHAILLDGPDALQYAHSTNGMIEGNTATYMSGSFMAHEGGDYTYGSIAGNVAHTNNRGRGHALNYLTRLRNAGTPVLAPLALAANGLTVGSQAIVDNDANMTDRSWHIQATDSPSRVLIIYRAAQDTGVSRYLAGNTALSRVTLESANPTTNPASHYWILENPITSRLNRLKHEESGKYLTMVPSPSGPAVNDFVLLRPDNPSNTNQFWDVVLVED